MYTMWCEVKFLRQDIDLVNNCSLSHVSQMLGTSKYVLLIDRYACACGPPCTYLGAMDLGACLSNKNFF